MLLQVLILEVGKGELEKVKPYFAGSYNKAEYEMTQFV